MQSFQIPSHGALLNAFVYVAAGAGPHPAVVLLHGFPGNERNLDLAQDIRRAGWDVLYFDYRGSWGSTGDFSFSHGIEDTAAAVDYLRSPTMAKIMRLDPSRIVLIGHSMGGFMAVQDAAADRSILGVGLISAADLGGRIPQPLPKEREHAAIKALSAAYDREGMDPISGCTPEELAHDTLANAAQWSFMAKVGSLKSRPASSSLQTMRMPGETKHSRLRCAVREIAGWPHSTCPPITSTPISAALFQPQFSGGLRRWFHQQQRADLPDLPAA